MGSIEGRNWVPSRKETGFHRGKKLGSIKERNWVPSRTEFYQGKMLGSSKGEKLGSTKGT